MTKKGKNRKVFLPARQQGKAAAVQMMIDAPGESIWREFDYKIRFFEEHLRRAYPHVLQVETHGDLQMGGVRICVSIDSGQTIGGTFRADELRMGGFVELQRWMRRIEASVRAGSHRDSYHQTIGQSYAGMRFTNTYVDDVGQPPAVTANAVRCTTVLRSNASEEAWMFIGDPADHEKRAQADERAKALFAMVAGQAAVDTLNKVQKLPITGSLGTKYWLLKQASYCIQRVDNGTGLCAVVPGVPLWDHLLGIKLMVENDEPAFLKTANVSASAMAIIDYQTNARSMFSSRFAEVMAQHVDLDMQNILRGGSAT